MADELVAWVDACVQRLLAAGYREVQVDGPVRVLRRSDFRALWAWTQLRTVVVIGVGERGDRAELDGFTESAFRTAMRTGRSWIPRGLQVGVAALPVLVVPAATADGREEAERRPDKDFAAFRCPVLVDVAAGTVSTYGGPLVWGGFYHDFLGEQQRVIAGGLTGATMQPTGSFRRLGRFTAVAAPLGVGLAVVGLAMGLLGRLLG